MNITNEQIAPELRMTGKLIRITLPKHYKESTIRFCNKIQGIMKGHAGKGLRYSQIYINEHGNTERGLRLCIYQPLIQKENAPGVLWIHGGGYAMGTPEQDEAFIRCFLEYGCTVVAPDYCLSTRKPYPAAIEDCYVALVWMKNYAEEYNIRTDQLMVGGDSAGGGLTAALTIYARDKKEVPIAFQMPLYPMLDDRMITPSSQNNDAPVWNSKSNECGWKMYLGDLYNKENVPVYAAPGRLTDFSGLPPAFSYVGSIEPFYDETIAYMEGLKQAGIPVHYQVFDGCFHGFDIVASKSPQAKQAKAFLKEQFEYAMKNYYAVEKASEITKA